MKILLIHNRYQKPGGEDAVLRAESMLLSRYGHHVEELIFDNRTIQTFADRLLSGLRLIYNPATARALKRRIEEFGPDIIHVHNFVPLASPSVFFVADKYDIPIILTLHNYRLICPGYTLFHKGKIYEKSIHSLFPLDAIVKGVYRNSILDTAAVAVMTGIHSMIGTWRYKVDAYITLTDFARNKFKTSAISIPSEKLRVKPNFVFDEGPGDATREDFFLFVGRLTEEKGIATLLQATTLADFKLVIVGEGPLATLVTEFASTNHNVTYIGFQDRFSVMKLIKSCKALIFPSVWYEGFPIAILEALSTGTIVIASKLGGMAEIIQDGVNGLHFEAGNVKDLVSRVREVGEGSDCVKAMSVNARRSYLERYTPEENYALLTRIYSHAILLKKNRRGDPARPSAHDIGTAYEFPRRANGMKASRSINRQRL